MNITNALFRGWCERFNAFIPSGKLGEVVRLTSNRPMNVNTTHLMSVMGPQVPCLGVK